MYSTNAGLKAKVTEELSMERNTNLCIKKKKLHSDDQGWEAWTLQDSRLLTGSRLWAMCGTCRRSSQQAELAPTHVNIRWAGQRHTGPVHDSIS